MRRKPIDSRAAESQAVDYLLREFRGLPKKTAAAQDAGGTTVTSLEVTYLNELIDVTTVGVVDGQHLVFVEAAEAFTVPAPTPTVSEEYPISTDWEWKMVDGDTGTYCQLGWLATANQWASFDFGDKVWIGQIDLHQLYAGRYAHTVTISTSPSGDNWTDIQTFASLTASENILTLTTPVNTQYIRITENTTTESYWRIHLVEFHTAGDTWMPVTASAADTSPLTTKGDLWGYDTANQRIPVSTNTYVLVADSTQALGVKWVANVKEKEFFQTGTLTIGSGTIRYYTQTNRVITGCYAMVSGAPVTSPAVFDVNMDGSTTIFTTQANRPSVAVAGFLSSVTVPDVTAWNAGSYLLIDVDAANSATDLIMVVQYTEA